jgi:hypothetical protein
MKWAIIVERVAGSSYIILDDDWKDEQLVHNWAHIHVPASTWRVLPVITAGEHMPG